MRTQIETVSQLITELQRLMGLHGDVRVESFFEGCTGGMNIHYEPERQPTAVAWSDGVPYLYNRDGEPATIYIGEEWYA